MASHMQLMATTGAFALALLLAVATASTTSPLPSSTTELPPMQVVGVCAPEVAACWERGTLWAQGGCHTPLEQGPCPDAHWLVLDTDALPRGKCAPRPCPPGQLPKRGRCLEEAEAREMCWSGAVHLDAEGAMRCGASPGWSALLEARMRCVDAESSTTGSDYPYYNGTDYYNGTRGFNSSDVYATESDYYANKNSTFYGRNNSIDTYDTAPDFYMATAYNTTSSYNVSSVYYNSAYGNSTGDDYDSTYGNARASPDEAVIKEPIGCPRGADGTCTPSVFIAIAAATHSSAQSLHIYVAAALCVSIVTQKTRW